MEPEDRQRFLRALPAVDELLRHASLQSCLVNQGRELILDSIRRVLARKRQDILRSATEESAARVETSLEHLIPSILEDLAQTARPSLRPLINATGVVLHTNLGRAPLPAAALQNIAEIAGRYSNLEFDIGTGERGKRYTHVQNLLRRISGAESALVVNNNAGAVLLALNSLAEGREVIVSRGQLVEIGGSFRVPDVMKKSGASLVEVGTTNRTHLRDYEQAIGEATALLLRVHTSNFRILGFTAEVSLKDLVALGHGRNLPVMEDLGSGCFVDLSAHAMEKEPTVQEALATGADLVTFSGDKLLGGPQAGIILGKRNYIESLAQNPLARALRIDKMTLAGLESILRLYLDRDRALREIPALRMLACPAEELEVRAKRLQGRLENLPVPCQVDVKRESSQMGGGALPLQDIPTFVVALRPQNLSAASLEERLRKNDPAVIARIKEDEVLLDPRTVSETEEGELIEAVRRALK